MQRREFFRNVLGWGAAAPVLWAGLCLPMPLWAAWDEAAFREEDFVRSIQAVLGNTPIEDSPKVVLKMPDQWQNGAVVPMEISTTLKEVESFTVFVAKNPTPLTGIYKLGKHVEPFVSTRIKVDGPGTTPVLVVVKAHGKLYRATHTVQVMVGGCT